MPRICVVGLGPGDPGLVTSATLTAISEIPHRYLRTTQHPSAHLLPDAQSFDYLYDSAVTFDEVYAQIAELLIAAAHQHNTVLYAVPALLRYSNAAFNCCVNTKM